MAMMKILILRITKSSCQQCCCAGATSTCCLATFVCADTVRNTIQHASNIYDCQPLFFFRPFPLLFSPPIYIILSFITASVAMVELSSWLKNHKPISKTFLKNWKKKNKQTQNIYSMNRNFLSFYGHKRKTLMN